MILYKACPRCGGDVMLDKDIYGTFVKCVQCARSKHVPVTDPIADLERRRYPRLPGEQTPGSVAV